VGRDDLGLEGEFFVDDLIMFRIHYPYAIAREARAVFQPGIDWPRTLRRALADLGSLHMVGNRLRDFWKRRVGDWLGFREPALRYDAPRYYHKGLPSPARSHGPHIDTWYGHSYDGINLWLSVAGVNRDNTVILYPELFGHPVAYDPRSMYVAAGIPLPAPVKVELSPGQLLLFNPEMLHGTQVNVSDETRFAITTRLNPRQPRFDPKADFHFQHWHSSKDLEAGRTRRLRVFPKTKYRGSPSVPVRKAPWIARSAVLRSGQRLRRGAAVDLCDSEALPVGEKMAVDLANARILLVRTASGLHALSRRCPHMGIDLIDGHHDETRVFCPGHGVAYSLEDGTSTCPLFVLRTWRASDVDGRIVLEPAPRDPVGS
jgi:nitrite reductase/ring-hydroxylating ferredoxin subunit